MFGRIFFSEIIEDKYTNKILIKFPKISASHMVRASLEDGEPSRNPPRYFRRELRRTSADCSEVFPKQSKCKFSNLHVSGSAIYNGRVVKMLLSRRLFTWSRWPFRATGTKRAPKARAGGSTGGELTPPLVRGLRGSSPRKFWISIVSEKQSEALLRSFINNFLHRNWSFFLYFYMKFSTWVQSERMHVLHLIKKYSFFHCLIFCFHY